MQLSNLRRGGPKAVSRDLDPGNDSGSAGLRIDSIGHTFRRRDQLVEALRDVSLSIGPDQFVCVLGPSGCGKSTLLKIVAGLVRPSEGAVYHNGRVIVGPGSDRGLVFQEPALFPWLRVIQNVEFGLRNAKAPKAAARARAMAVLGTVGLAGKARQFPNQLSGGQAQRVAVARAWSSENASLLLMDEPFAAVDAIGRRRLQDHLLTTWTTEPRTVVFVTHDIGEAVYLADTVVLMDANPGRIAEVYDVPPDARRMRDTAEGKGLEGEIRRRMETGASD